MHAAICRAPLPHLTILLERCTRLGGRATSREMCSHVSPRFPISPPSAFSSTCCSCYCCRCCCCGVHTVTPCDLKFPFRYARRGCPRLYSHRGASAAAVLPSFRRDTTLTACSYAFTIEEFRQWWYSSPPCSTSGGWRLIPTGLLLCLALDASFLLNQLIEGKALSIRAHEAAPEPTFFL